MVIEDDEVLFGSGRDLSNYFYSLRHTEGWEVRNAFGRKLHGSNYAARVDDPAAEYYACFVTIVMGDLNAVDLAHQLHADLLRQYECLHPDHQVHYGLPTPGGRVWELLYIDDMSF